MIENKLDVTELPVAETVKDGDQFLLVRTQKNGVKVPMRMESKKLTKQKKQQIVIGRAIRPRACQIGGVENWYVFGRSLWNSSLLLLNICSMSSYTPTKPDLGYDVVVLNITHQKTGTVFVFKSQAPVFEGDCKNFIMTFRANKFSAQTTDWQNVFLLEGKLANAFRVDSYDLTARVLTLNLTHKYLPTTDLRGTSTHHYFKDGLRRWHVSKMEIAKIAFDISDRYWNGTSSLVFDQYDVVVYSLGILLKKEVRQRPKLPRGDGRGFGNVMSYSKVDYRRNDVLCQLNNSKSKRRPYGKYMIWALDLWYPRRKSDEYLHCRMKCVGLGQIKNVEYGPRFDRYRVTVREI